MDHRSQNHYYTHLQQRHGSIPQHGYGSSKFLSLSFRISFVANILLTMWVIILMSMYWNRNIFPNSLKVRNGEELTFHGGNPKSHSISGSCWCNTGSLSNPTPYCMCNPALAIDLVIVTVNDVDSNKIENNDLYVWLVRRKDTNQLATLGGFVMVGESVEDAVIRELKEETGIDLLQKSKSTNRKDNIQPILFGVYSDPRRDNRRHTTSAVYAIHLDGTEKLKAADDVKDVVKISIHDIEKYTYFADHMTILLDYRKILLHERSKRKELQKTENINQVGHQLRADDFRASNFDFANDIKRSICIPLLE